MQPKPTPPEAGRRMKRLYITIDDATESRLIRYRDRHAGLKSISAVVRHLAQLADDADSRK